MRKVDIDILRKHLLYNHETGDIYSRTSRGNVKVGKKLGTLSGNGYMTIHVCGITLYFHRAAFALYHGFFPDMIDHINGDRLDNRIINLRPADSLLNARNARAKYGKRFKGIFKRSDCWQVSIRSNKKQLYIGRFNSEIEAAYAYDMASIIYHGDCGKRNFLPFVI